MNNKRSSRRDAVRVTCVSTGRMGKGEVVDLSVQKPDFKRDISDSICSVLVADNEYIVSLLSCRQQTSLSRTRESETLGQCWIRTLLIHW